MKINRELVLGYAPTRRDTFPDPKNAIAQRDPIRKRVEEIINKIGNVRIVDINWLNDEGLLVENCDALRTAKRFQQESVDALFIPHCNFGQEEAIAKLAKALNVPTLLWGPRDPIPPENFGTRQTDVQCGLFASGKALNRYGVPFTYVENCWLDSPILEQGLADFIRVANVVRTFRGMRVGQIDVRPRQFLSVKVNESELLERFGIEIIPIGAGEIIPLIQTIKDSQPEQLQALIDEFAARTDISAQTHDEMKSMAAIELAILELVKRYDLTAVATECWDLFRTMFGVKPCFIMGDLTEKGIPVSCETDIHGAITSAVMTAAARGDSPTFLADVTIRHPENDNVELLWHCGPFPRSLVRDGCDPKLVEWHGQWELKGGDITVARFDMKRTGEYCFFADHCRGVDGPPTCGNYVWIETDNWPQWERKFVCGPYIHHVTGVHGKYAKIIQEACKYMNGVHYDCADMPL